MAVAQSEWINLSNPPTYMCSVCISHILPLNQSEILVIIRHGLYPWTLKEIWTYNIYKDNYTRLISEKNIKIRIANYEASLHDNKSFLYFFGDSGKIIKVNLKTQEFQVSNKSYHESLFFNEQFHIFVALLTSTNEIIISTNSKHVYRCSLSTKKYMVKYQSRILWYPQGLLTRNKKYIIVYDLKDDFIFICDIKLQKAWESNIKKEKDMKFAIISDIQKEELLCCGYIRKCWKLSKFKQITVLPYYLTQIIDAYFAIETIHMMNTEKHLCLNIDYILNTKLS